MLATDDIARASGDHKRKRKRKRKRMAAHLAMCIHNEQQQLTVGGSAPGGAHTLGMLVAAEEARAHHTGRVIQRDL